MPSSPLVTTNAALATQSIEPVDVAAGERVPIRLSIHDATRVEWTVSIPFPAHGTLSYSVEVELNLPSNAIARNAPWEQLQTLTRLVGPSAVPISPENVTLDALRRAAVSAAHMLRRAREGFERHCREALRHKEGEETQPRFLSIWLSAAARVARDVREQLTHSTPTDTPESARERALIDEFVSVGLLEMLADADAVLTHAHAEAQRFNGTRGRGLAAAREVLDDAVRQEVEYRRRHAFLGVDPSSPVALERYAARTTVLKKHFEEVLFLERETRLVDERVRGWMTLVAGLLAGSLAFVIQIALGKSLALPAHLGSGMILLALLAGIAYAARDRIKEAARAWLTGKVYRYHAQRVSRSRLPQRRAHDRAVVVEAREWCTQTTYTAPNPLSPESGASLPKTLVSYLHRGTVFAQPALTGSGVEGIRHVFRYDLSPLFPRLHDEVKRVPVIENDARVRFAEAPRRYYAPISIEVRLADRTAREKRVIVLDKRGLRRVDPGQSADQTGQA